MEMGQGLAFYWLMNIHLLVIMTILPVTVKSAEIPQWYGETHEQSNQRVLSQLLQMRSKFSRPFYGMLGINHLSFPGEEGRADSASHIFGELNCQLIGDQSGGRDWGQLSIGIRLKKYYGVDSSWQRQTKKIDLRILYVLGDYQEFFSHVFRELYWETIYTSADQNNLITTIFYRIGLMVNQGPWRWDLFTAPILKLDRLGHFYYNLGSWELMARMSRRFSHWSMALSAGLSFDHYFRREVHGDLATEVNPYQTNKLNGKILLTLGSW